MHYVDTSVFVALVTMEPRHNDVRLWFGAQQPNVLHTSRWTKTELASALAIKVRTKQISLEMRGTALSLYAKLVDKSVVVVPILDLNFDQAAMFVDKIDLGLRGGDALHLAVASANELTAVTLDKQMAKAGLKLGVSTLLL
jgi:predicted nucleic acid-binding protein